MAPKYSRLKESPIWQSLARCLYLSKALLERLLASLALEGIALPGLLAIADLHSLVVFLYALRQFSLGVIVLRFPAGYEYSLLTRCVLLSADSPDVVVGIQNGHRLMI